MTTLHSKQSSTKEPAIVAEGYQMCQCFPYMHSAAGFSAPLSGGRLAHLPEPHAELLETDLGTVIKLLSLNILIQNNCIF